MSKCCSARGADTEMEQSTWEKWRFLDLNVDCIQSSSYRTSKSSNWFLCSLVAVEYTSLWPYKFSLHSPIVTSGLQKWWCSHNLNNLYFHSGPSLPDEERAKQVRPAIHLHTHSLLLSLPGRVYPPPPSLSLSLSRGSNSSLPKSSNLLWHTQSWVYLSVHQWCCAHCLPAPPVFCPAPAYPLPSWKAQGQSLANCYHHLILSDYASTCFSVERLIRQIKFLSTCRSTIFELPRGSLLPIWIWCYRLLQSPVYFV